MSSSPQIDAQRAHSANGKRLHQIDALRGLAAILVLVTHASSSFSSYASKFGHSDWLSQFARSVDTGRIGVMIFFIVSGFVVANTLHAPGASLSKFAIKRLFRLYPLFWFSIVLVIFFLQGRNELIPLIADWKTAAANSTMMPTLLGFDPLMNIYWTLETEVVFYLIAAAVYRVGWLFHPTKLFASICTLIIAFAAIMFGVIPSPGQLSWKSLTLNLAFMFWGSLFYTVFATTDFQSIPKKLGTPIVFATAAILSPSLFATLRFLSTPNADDLRWAIAYPSALLLFSTIYFAKGAWIQTVSRLGLISYSMYLLHPAAITAISLLMDGYGIPSASASLPLLSLFATFVAIAMSVVSYNIIEKPFISLGRRLTSGFGSPIKLAKSAPLFH